MPIRRLSLKGSNPDLGETERGISEDGAPDPQDKIWSVYISETAQTDKALAKRWKADMDGILIFAGLFSATLTAFITQSYKKLQPDPSEATVLLLTHISQQLANSSVVMPFNPAPFKPDPASLRVNAYWFLSLAFSISCALGATLVQQWARSYQESVESHSVPNKRARIRAYLQEGVELFGIRGLVNAIPVLLHISVFFFMIGLFDFLHSINKVIAYLTFGIVGGFLGFYIIFTLLPIIYHNCPYKTPLSAVCWRILQTIHLLRFRNDREKFSPFKKGLSFYRVHVATKPSSARRSRDERALHLLLESFKMDSEFEQIISGIPDFLSSQDDNPGIAFWEKFQSDDVALCTRITNLLVTCQSGGVLSETTRHRRAQICLNAIWSLTQSSLLTTHGLKTGQSVPPEAPQISSWAISQATVAAIAALKHNHSPSIAIYVSCTIAIVSCKILEHWSTATEVELLETLRVLELLDVYKFLPAQQQLSMLQQRKQEWEEKEQYSDPIQELEKDPELGQKLRSELALLRQDGYFGVLIAFVHSLSDLKNLSVHSGLPLARKTFDVIISRFPDAPPTYYTQSLLVKCLRRAIVDEAQQGRFPSEQSDKHSPAQEFRQPSYSSDSVSSMMVPNPTKLPISLIDRILPSVIHSLREPRCLEAAKTLISDYRENFSESVAAARTLLKLEEKIRGATLSPATKEHVLRRKRQNTMDISSIPTTD